MSVTPSGKKHAALTLADCQRLLDHAQALQAEVDTLRRERDGLKTVIDHARAVEELPALRAERDLLNLERDTARIEAQEIRDQAHADGEAEKARLVAEGEAAKSKAIQAANYIIAEAKRTATLEATEAAAQERRLLADREAKLAARERDVANALKPYREARGRILAAIDAVEKIPVMGGTAGRA